MRILWFGVRFLALLFKTDNDVAKENVVWWLSLLQCGLTIKCPPTGFCVECLIINNLVTLLWKVLETLRHGSWLKEIEHNLLSCMQFCPWSFSIPLFASQILWNGKSPQMVDIPSKKTGKVCGVTGGGNRIYP